MASWLGRHEEEETLLLFEKVKPDDIKCVYSDLTGIELKNAPQNERDFFHQPERKFPERIEASAGAFVPE
jgi:ATP-dependent Clp protease ATP-binding subunit ClpA